MQFSCTQFKTSYSILWLVIPFKERNKYGSEEESQEDDEEGIQDDLVGPGPEEGPGQEEGHQESRAEEEKEISS